MMAYKGIRKTLYWKFIQKDLLQKAAAIHAITASEEARIRELGIQAPTCVVPNGVFLPHEGGALPPDFPKGSIVLFVGRIHPVKGLDVLLEAFARVTYPCTLVVAGPDPDGQWANLKLRVPHAKVVFLGCVDDADLGAVYRRADILVLPSRSEVLGLVTLEAMAHRVPVLISPFCGLSERDLAGAGEIVDLDPNLLARAIEALLANPDRRARMGEAGLQLVRDRYAWDAIGRSLADLYKGLGQAS
jgi:glycosyltransferase involved in cell wall biosynthesis